MFLDDPTHWVQFSHCQIGGYSVVTASRAELAEAMVEDCLAARRLNVRPRLVFDVNGHGLSLRETNIAYRDAMTNADVIHADGGFIVTLSRKITDKPIRERSVTTDMFHDCAKAAVEHGLSFFLLGGEEKDNLECALRLQSLHPGLKIAGRRHGFFSEAEEIDVINAINAAAPDILWVGLGKPKEQIFSVRWGRSIKAGWLITCGGCFNYVSGRYKRAPLWMQRANLEWLHRMVTNPKLIWRYMVTNPHAIWIILRKS
jgi:N-acetylglucosaminyldiphosphoundecaprenol N-acetyl-beta-D-mannosaminyltransferase